MLVRFDKCQFRQYYRKIHTTFTEVRLEQMHIQPLTIHIPQADLDDLQDRLKRTRWPDEVDDAGWDYGANLAYMQELIAYWRTTFDWRSQEQTINAFANFRAEIDGVGIHFIHEHGKGSNPIPLVLTHGWPSSFAEMLKIIPMLTDPNQYGADPADSFDVIVPSIPGFGFSDRPLQRGMTRSRVADLWVHLMEELGYPRFAAHANDIGAVITCYIARDYPSHLLGYHTLMPHFPSPSFDTGTSTMSEAERRFAACNEQWEREEGGYNLIQETRPQTLAYGLNDSPAGLAAWIIEKWRSWGAIDGYIERSFTMDELLTNVTIYWVTRTANSSSRSYYERAHDHRGFGLNPHIAVPTGVALTMETVQRAPREWVERVYTDIRHWTEFDHGGHFLATEDPTLLAADIRTFFRKLR
jgi:pimeloyl-ACP methyl ester carboxylesterase